MNVKAVNRRVCGEDSATDFFMERSLAVSEIENLNKELRGHLSAFGNLFYIDFEIGRLTISSNSLRCTLRTKIDNSDEKQQIYLYLEQLDESANLEVVN